MIRVMCDLETLGVSSNAPILSIGAVVFDADTGVITPALACRSRPTAAAAPLGMYFCTPNGETALLPRARMSS